MPGWKRTTPAAPKHTREQRTRILRRDPLCTCDGCHRCANAGHCTRPSTEADHITPRHKGGTNHPANMRGLCTPCHAVKSSREGRAARGSERRAPEQHPGLNG
jgi:5-methylcytosine-specific restriction protein A